MFDYAINRKDFFMWCRMLNSRADHMVGMSVFVVLDI